MWNLPKEGPPAPLLEPDNLHYYLKSLRKPVAKGNQLSLSVKEINVQVILLLFFHINQEPVRWYPLNSTLGSVAEVILKLGPRGDEVKFPSPERFCTLISFVAPGHVFINLPSFLARVPP